MAGGEIAVTFNITHELRHTFGLASLRQEAAKILNAKEWKEFQKIRAAHAGIKRVEQRAYEMEYITRVEVARKRLINKAGSKTRDFKHRWFGSDRFDKSAIGRQAHRQVKAQHAKLLGHLENQEIKDVQSLLNACEKRTRQREKPKRDFKQATNRRKDAQQRRQPRSRKPTR